MSIVGGYFTGVYGWTELTDDVKSQILAQIGNNLSLYYWITTLQTLIYVLIFGFFGYNLSDKTGLMKPIRFEKKPVMVTIGMSLFTGLVVCTDLFYFRNHIPQVAAVYLEKPSFAYWMASVLYGGVIEEILLRLFMMSLIAFLAWKVTAMTTLELMLMYGKEASNRKQEIDRQHYTIPNQRPKDKHCGKI